MKPEMSKKFLAETNQQAYNILFSNYYMRDFPDVENTSVFFERRK